MAMIKVAICDDNEKERQFFVELCKSIRKQQEIDIKIRQYESGEVLLFHLEDTKVMHNVDIVLLDIYMPGKDGIAVAGKLREMGFRGEIIFITRSQEHWRDAFDVHAFNYITKDEDIQMRFNKVFLEAAENAQSHRGKSLLLSSVAETRMIDVDKISHFEIWDHVVTVYYGENESFEFVSTLAKIESLLFGDDFIRINRSFLISMAHIAVDSLENNTVRMRNGATIHVGRNARKVLRDAMAARNNGVV